jgi:hypothetical protein
VLPVKGGFCDECLTVRRLVSRSKQDAEKVGQVLLSKNWLVMSTKGRPMFKTQELCRVIQRNKRLIASKFSQCSTHGPAEVSLEELVWGTFWPPVNDLLGWPLYIKYKAVKLLQSEKIQTWFECLSV